MILGDNLLSFIHQSPSNYHAVETIKKTLLTQGFIGLLEDETWELKQNQGYYVIRGAGIVAFKIGAEIDAFKIVATHTDSPGFKLKPQIQKEQELLIEPYGGTINYSWLDRPLSVAGRVIYSFQGKIYAKLIDIDENLLTITSPSIHYQPDINNGVKIPMNAILPSSSTSVVDLICRETGCQTKDIMGTDLFLYNRARGSYLGVDKELIQAPQLDNLAGTFCALESFITSSSKGINVLACLNNEEVGSRTIDGAGSDFLKNTLFRINASIGNKPEELMRLYASSLIVSCDNAQAFNARFADKFDVNHVVKINSGIAIKHSASQSYVTNGVSHAFFKNILDEANIPYQEFANRNDQRGGSTLGAINLQSVGINSIDIGLPQWAMHSSMETIGSLDLECLVKGLKAFYETPSFKIEL